MKKLLIILGCVLCVGCASRTIEIEGYGRYYSNMNSEIENFELKFIKPDGTIVEVKFERSTADPAETIRAQREMIEAITPAIISGVLQGLMVP